MDWRNRIDTKTEVLAGKPVVKGTRLSVEFLLGLFAEGWSEEQVLENYPQLAREDIRAAFAFSADLMHEETFSSLVSFRPQVSKRAC